jgi:ABC-type Na+ efflux pump permease subunit
MEYLIFGSSVIIILILLFILMQKTVEQFKGAGSPKFAEYGSNPFSAD